MRRIPAARIPTAADRNRSGVIVSAIVHALILLFLLSPAALLVDPNLKEELLGAGGPGPAGGGGGGARGTGSVRFVQIAPVPKPEPPKVAPPEVIPPKPPEPVLPPLDLPKLAQENKVEVKVQTPIVGTGGGTGNDGTAGNGPGTGGGVGTGVGTGRGSGVGPGTGGGGLENYPPTPLEMFIPPLPTPSSVHGFHLIANFDIDEKGKVISVVFTPSKDNGYNRRLQDYLKTFKFRPGTTPKGEPIRAKYQMIVDF